MIIPYNTDAPIYHLPIATGAMIGVNVLVYLATSQLDEYQLEQYVVPWILQHGTFNPLQWISSNFIHANFLHLLGNMFGLWTFGLLVEGKIGWRWFLAVFFGIGMGQCFLEQTLTLLAEEGGSFGASSIVYGLLAICLIWAPQNEMSCVIIVGWRVLNCDLKVLTVAEIVIGIEMLFGVLAGLAMNSQILHLMGVGLGLGVGIVFLKNQWVDCENWDLFSVWKGTNYKTIAERDEEAWQELERGTRKGQEQQQLFAEDRKQAGLDEIRRLIQAGNPSAAYVANVKLANSVLDWQIPERELLGIIAAYHRKEMWSESIPALVDYLRCYFERESPVRLKLAQILIVHEQRPVQGLKVVEKLNPAFLDEKQADLYHKLRRKAKQLQSQGVLEAEIESW